MIIILIMLISYIENKIWILNLDLQQLHIKSYFTPFSFVSDTSPHGPRG